MDTFKKKQLKADYHYCEKIIKASSKSFYYAFSKLPSEKAKAVFAIYAFCRRADDTMDKKGTYKEKLADLNRMRQELELFEQGNEPDKPMWRALRDVFTTFDASIEPYYIQLKGQEMDLDFSPPYTMEELESYSCYVAGSVGKMLLPILASETNQDLRATATQLGTAMQLTNILRDVGEDYREIQRVYLPTVEMEKADYAVEELRNSVINSNFINLWERIARRSEKLYAEAKEGINYFDEDSRFQIQLSANIYGEILNSVRENGYDCFNKRNYVKPSKIKILSNELKQDYR